MAAPAAQAPKRRPHVLVVGAGFAGVALAQKLAAAGGFDVTLVDRKPYFEVAYANARTLVDPALADRSVIPISELKPHGSFVCGEVTALTPTAALLADGRALPFDYAAICTGSAQAVGKGAAGGATERRGEIKILGAQLRAAPGVVVVGGGPLGVELAAEVATALPGKPLALVHAGGRVLPALPPKAAAAAHAWLEAHGCKVLLNDRLLHELEPTGQQLLTVNGARLPPGALVLWATGSRPATGFMRAELADCLEHDTGLIKVEPTLQVAGHPHIFALGDACNVREEKLAFLAKMHARVVADNITVLAAQGWHLQAGAGAGGAPGGGDAESGGGKTSGCAGGGSRAAKGKLQQWKPGMGLPKVMMVSLGPRSGIVHMGFIAFSGWLAAKIKNIDVLVGLARKEVCRAP